MDVYNFFFFSFLFFFSGEQPFGVIQPFPENIYPLEYTSANVTCITFDASGKLQPDRIEFYRRDDLNQYRKLGGDRFVFNQRTENISEYIFVLQIMYLAPEKNKNKTTSGPQTLLPKQDS